MQVASVAALAIALAAGTSVATVALFFDPNEVDAATTETEQRLDGLVQKIERLEKENADLRRQIEKPRLQGDSGRELAEIGDAQIQAAIDRWLAKNGDKLALGASKKKLVQVDMTRAFGMLTDTKVSYDERQKMWAQVAKAGKLDEMIKRLKAHAKNAPNDAEAQVALGNGLVQKIMSGNISGMEQATVGMAIDKAYAKALELDPEHWEARYTRAIGMTHWPAFTGGQRLAIENFNTLIEQQEKRQPKPEYASTYVLLGNVYAQQGKNDKAKEVWERGARLFPNDKDLKGVLGK